MLSFTPTRNKCHLMEALYAQPLSRTSLVRTTLYPYPVVPDKASVTSEIGVRVSPERDIGVRGFPARQTVFSI